MKLNKIKTNKIKTNKKTNAILLIAVFILSTIATVIPIASAATITTVTPTDIVVGGVYTSLTGPVIVESASAEIVVGTIILTAPVGFEFETGTVTLAITNGGTMALSSGTATATARTITHTVSTISNSEATLTYTGIKIRATTVSEVTGNLEFSGTAGVTGSAGTLSSLRDLISVELVGVSGDHDATWILDPEAGEVGDHGYVARIREDDDTIDYQYSFVHVYPVGNGVTIGTLLTDLPLMSFDYYLNDLSGGEQYAPEFMLTFAPSLTSSYFAGIVVSPRGDPQSYHYANTLDTWLTATFTGDEEYGTDGVDSSGSFNLWAGDTLGDHLVALKAAQDVTDDWILVKVSLQTNQGTESDDLVDNFYIDGVMYNIEPIVLDADYYHTDGSTTVNVYDWSQNTDPNSRDVVSIDAMSATIDPNTIIIALRETGINTGIFTGTFDLVGETPGTGELLVSTGDTITATYDPALSVTATLDDTAPVVEITEIDGVLVTADAFLPFVKGDVPITAEIDETTTFDVLFEVGTVNIGTGTGTGLDVEISKDWDTLATLGEVLTWPEGTYTITVTVTDAAGNIGTDSITLTVDNTAPNAYNYEPAGGSYIIDTTPTIGFDITDLGSDVEEDSIAMTVGGDSITPLEVTAITNGFHVEYSLGTSEALSGGTFIVTATANDEVGNTLTLDIPIMNENVGIGTGSEPDFDLDYTPITDSEIIYINGAPQVEGGGEDYTISGNTITFDSAPDTGDIITASYKTTTWSFTIDLTEPTMDSAATDTKTEVDITFSEELDPETVDATDFLVDGAIPSEVSVDGAVVTLTVSTMSTYATPTVILTGDGVADLVGNVLTEEELIATDGIEPEVSVTVSPDPTTTYAVSGVKTIFTLTFSENMDTGVPLTLSHGNMITDEDVGTGTNSPTVFNLDFPVVAGSETIYLAGEITTAYSLVDSTGVITFDSAPGNGVAITADYTAATPISGTWTSGTVWMAEYNGIPLETSDDVNYLSISDAEDISGNMMEADISNTFTIDTTVEVNFWPANDADVYTDSPIVVIDFDEVVTVTVATFDVSDALIAEDVLADLTTADYMTYRLVTQNLEEEQYTITIIAEDALGNEIETSATFTISVSVDIDLVEGWNLISLPLIPDDSSIEVVLADILDNVNIVYGYEADAWSYYSPAVPDFATLTDIEDGKGYWIEMTADDTLTIYGTDQPAPPQVPPVYNVYEGWNLIGFKSRTTMDHDVYLSTIPDDIQSNTVIYGWNALTQSYDQAIIGFETSTELTSGKGYWLYMIGDAVIVP